MYLQPKGVATHRACVDVPVTGSVAAGEEGAQGVQQARRKTAASPRFGNALAVQARQAPEALAACGATYKHAGSQIANPPSNRLDAFF